MTKTFVMKTVDTEAPLVGFAPADVGHREPRQVHHAWPSRIRTW
jgi:hypothetical protein